jgi:uncharacterized protein YlxP (DUF503 family)
VTAWIGKARLTLYLHGAMSLKDKRSEISSLTHRLRQRFNASVAEIEDQNDMRVATIGIIVLSSSSSHCDQMLATILKAAEDMLDMAVPGEVETELVPFDG